MHTRTDENHGKWKNKKWKNNPHFTSGDISNFITHFLTCFHINFPFPILVPCTPLPILATTPCTIFIYVLYRSRAVCSLPLTQAVTVLRLAVKPLQGNLTTAQPARNQCMDIKGNERINGALHDMCV